MSKQRKPPQPGESETRRALAPPDVVTLECPLGEIPPGVYITPHVDLQLDPHQAATLRKLVEGLDLARVRLRNSRRVTTGADALRYLLEGLAQPAVSRETVA
jgi:hypothetical protein